MVKKGGLLYHGCLRNGFLFFISGVSILMHLKEVICISNIETVRAAADQIKRDAEDYCRDLHQLTSGFLDDTVLRSEMNGSFSDLFDRAVSYHPDIISKLNTVDFCIISHATYEYHAYFTHVSTYLADYYKIKTNFFDMMLSGASELAAVFDILLRVNSEKMAIIFFEQTVLPLKNTQKKMIPKNNATGILFFSNKKNFPERNEFSLLDSYLFHFSCFDCDQ